MLCGARLFLSIVVVMKRVNLSKFSHVNYSSNRMVVFICLCNPNGNIILKHDFLSNSSNFISYQTYRDILPYSSCSLNPRCILLCMPLHPCKTIAWKLILELAHTQITASAV